MTKKIKLPQPFAAAVVGGAKVTGFRHMNITKEWAADHVRRFGAQEVLGRDMAAEEAVRAIMALPGQFIANANCDNFDPETGCKGHVKK